MNNYSEDRIIEILVDMIDLLNESEINNCKLIDILKDLEAQQNDLSHKIELEDNKTDERKLELLEQFETIRKKRRKVKDQIDFNYPIKQFSKNNPQVKSQLRYIVNKLNKKQQFRETREYHEKTRKVG